MSPHRRLPPYNARCTHPIYLLILADWRLSWRALILQMPISLSPLFCKQIFHRLFQYSPNTYGPVLRTRCRFDEWMHARSAFAGEGECYFAEHLLLIYNEWNWSFSILSAFIHDDITMSISESFIIYYRWFYRCMPDISRKSTEDIVENDELLWKLRDDTLAKSSSPHWFSPDESAITMQLLVVMETLNHFWYISQYSVSILSRIMLYFIFNEIKLSATQPVLCHHSLVIWKLLSWNILSDNAIRVIGDGTRILILKMDSYFQHHAVWWWRFVIKRW